MFKGQKAYDEIHDRVETAISNIFWDYQTKYDLSGDIDPLDSLELDDLTDKLTELVTRVLQFEYDWQKGGEVD